MHCRAVQGSSITSANDPRVFPVGRILRSLKIDELPQLLNIVKGDMAIVGPRPEAPDIVDRHYTTRDRQSLAVPPGLTSPGSVFYYTHGERLLADGAAEDFYVAALLPLKMTIDLEYLSRAGLWSDVGVILSTASVLFQKALGRKQFPTPAVLQRSIAAEGPDETIQRTAA
jgi:lipopolysaccharide/colanic/teichoic acid biosynthesis glycosyltransferase